jgi:hypothetical protein
MPYDDVSGQKSASQYSLQTTSSNGRSAKMYPDPESARRGIMNLATAGSQQTIVLHPSDDSSTLSYNNEDQLEQSQTSNRGRIAGVLDFHPNVEEAAASDPDPINPSRYRPTARDEGFQSPYFHAQPRGEGDSSKSAMSWTIPTANRSQWLRLQEPLTGPAQCIHNHCVAINSTLPSVRLATITSMAS